MKILRWCFPFLFRYRAEWEIPAVYRFARRAGRVEWKGVAD